MSAIVQAQTPPRTSALHRALHSLVRARWPLLAVFLLSLVSLAALLGPTLAERDPNRQNIVARLKQPMQVDRRGHVFVLGTDGLGRDVLSRLLYGARVSLLVGRFAGVVGGSIGTVRGMLAAEIAG